ncbi:hypothetical protein AAVH_15459, partial [Aphelenchoides avenae]
EFLDADKPNLIASYLRLWVTEDVKFLIHPAFVASTHGVNGNDYTVSKYTHVNDKAKQKLFLKQKFAEWAPGYVQCTIKVIEGVGL